MERPDLSKVTKILTAGQWIVIEEGSLENAGGVQFILMGEIQPLFRFCLEDGTPGVILASRVDGFAPLVTDEAPARLADMSEFRHPVGIPAVSGREGPGELLGLGARPSSA